MKHLVLFFLIIIPQFLCASNVKVDVFLSSRDCMKCIAQTMDIVKEVKSENYDVSIYVEYKSKRKQVLESLGQLVSNIDLIVDKQKVFSKTEEGNSKIEVRCEEVNFSSDLNDFELENLKELCPNDENYNQIAFSDTIFEDGNFNVFIEDDVFYFLHNDYNVLKISDLSNVENPTSLDLDISISEDEYNSIVRSLSKELDKEVMFYKSAVFNSKKNFLPLQLNNAVFVKNDKIVLLQCFNFYIKIENRDYMFRGQNYISVGSIQNNFSNIEFKRNRVQLDNVSGYKSALAMNLTHTSLDETRFIAPTRLYNETDEDQLISNGAIGKYYTINDDNSIDFGDTKFIGSVAVNDSMQTILRKHLYGASSFNQVDEKLYIKYPFLGKIVDVSENTVVPIHNFLKEKYTISEFSNTAKSIGLDLYQTGYKHAFSENGRFYINSYDFNSSLKNVLCDFSTDNKGSIYYFKGALYKVFKNDELQQFELSKCSCNSSIPIN